MSATEADEDSEAGATPSALPATLPGEPEDQIPHTVWQATSACGGPKECRVCAELPLQAKEEEEDTKRTPGTATVKSKHKLTARPMW